MRQQSLVLLSDYFFGKVSLEDLRDFVDRVDWDDPQLPKDERSVLLNVEARIVGLDEGLNSDSEIKQYLFEAVPALNTLWLNQPSIISGTGDARLEPGIELAASPGPTITISNGRP